MASTNYELMHNCQTPLRISWSANLDSGMDVAELCKYLLENPETTAALYLDFTCKHDLMALFVMVCLTITSATLPEANQGLYAWWPSGII